MRQLIWVTRPCERLSGATRIGPDYRRDYTPAQMREWAQETERIRTTPQEDVNRLDRLASGERTDAQQAFLNARLKLLDSDRGINGNLGPDGTVTLDGGRHRSAYMLEQGIDPIPVWISNPYAPNFSAFQEQCRSEQLLRDMARQHVREGARTPAAPPRNTPMPVRSAPTQREPLVLWERRSPPGTPERTVPERTERTR